MSVLLGASKSWVDGVASISYRLALRNADFITIRDSQIVLEPHEYIETLKMGTQCRIFTMNCMDTYMHISKVMWITIFP